MSDIRGGDPGKLIVLTPGQILAIVEERDQLEDWQNSVASRMGDNFDGDEGQEWIIDRWLDLVEARLRIADTAWHRYLFLSGPDPRTDEGGGGA